MPAPTFSNSPSSSELSEAWVETGTVASVNVRNLTVDWVSQYTGKQIPDLQIMTPYLHYNNGEGFTCVPEVGAICAVCFPSDEESPFVLGFLSAPELEGAEFGRDFGKVQLDPGVETEEDVKGAQGTASTGSTQTGSNVSDASFRAGRPVLNPGDMLWQGRDGNFIALRRGGVLQIGSTHICQRAYVPILNTIRDFCENYELNSAAGTLSWGVQRVENSPSGDAPSELVLVAREFAQDKKASIKVSLGSLDDADKPPGGDKTYVELTIAPESIDPSDGSVSGKPKYVIRLDKAGNSFVMQTSARTEEIGGDYTLKVGGNQTVTVGGNRSATITGNDETTITGLHSVTGVKSDEIWSGPKTIGATQLFLGGPAATLPVLLGPKLLAWLISHTHMVNAMPGPAPIPTLPAMQAPDLTPDKMLSKVVKIAP